MHKGYLTVLQLEVMCLELVAGSRPTSGRCEEQRYQELMHAYHYLGSPAKIIETLWYIACVVTNGSASELFPPRPGSVRHGITGSAGVLASV